jgi:isocitrate dehydrogenase
MPNPSVPGPKTGTARLVRVGSKLGIAPDGNINYVSGRATHAIEAATHGSALKYANPFDVGSFECGGERLHQFGWLRAADLVIGGLDAAFGVQPVKHDFHRWMAGAKLA